MDSQPRRRFSLAAWSLLTAVAGITLATEGHDTVQVLCGAAVVLSGVVTIALMLTGRTPRWVLTRQERRALKNREP